MNWRDIGYLITETTTKNEIGDRIPTPGEKQVFCNKKSIRQSEHYQAMANGLKPEIMFEIRAHDYSGEKKFKYNNKTYNIIREFSKNGEITELVCQGLVNNA